jgi:hypothetical protein
MSDTLSDIKPLFGLAAIYLTTNWGQLQKGFDFGVMYNNGAKHWFYVQFPCFFPLVVC